MSYAEDKTLQMDRPPAPADGAAPPAAEERTLDLALADGPTRTLPTATQRPPVEATSSHIALPNGYQLLEYTIESLLGTGGFGLTYLARDNHLACPVAIKEYLPNDMAIRVTGQTVCPRSSEWIPDYQAGLKRFVNEARILASFRHPNVVRVSRFFEANGTAYMVMDYERGHSLRDWRRHHPTVTEAEALSMFLPLLDGLAVVHQGQITHRDIKPANIYVREGDGSLVLLDFGSARPTDTMGSQGLTTIVTPGYAPFEQYHSSGVQGPWSDIYALGGVLYWLVTGDKPLDAPARMKEDTLEPARERARGLFSPSFLAAIDWALACDENKRPRTVAEFRAALTGEKPVPAAAATPAPPAAAMAPAAAGKKSGGALWLGVGVAVLAVAGFAGRQFLSKPAEAPVQQAVAETPVPAASVPGEAPAKVADKPAKAPGAKAEKPAARADKPAAQAEPERSAAAAAPSKAAPAAAAAGGSARIVLHVQPHGEVYLDGKKMGKSPPLAELPVAPGEHKVEIRGDDMPYVSYHKVEVKAGETRQVSQKFGQ